MRFVPAAAFAAILLSAVAADPSAFAGPAPSKTPKAAIFAANYYEVTAYPLGSNGDVPPIAVTTDFAAPTGIARDSSGRLYVTNLGSNTVTVFAADANGNVQPIAVIGGPHSRLFNPAGVALGANGTIYVVNHTAATKDDSVVVFPPLAGSGILDESPVSEIAGSKTLLDRPSGIALDSHGNIYVANESGGPRVPHQPVFGRITVYAAGSAGNVAPIAVISGARTGLGSPTGIALDSNDNIYVMNFYTTTDTSSITVYPEGSRGNFSPIATITGDHTNSICCGIAVDATGNIYTAGCAPGGGPCATVNIFAAGSDGDVAPTTSIFNGAAIPIGLALDSSRNIYVLNLDGGVAPGGEIVVYPAGSSGNAVPRATINDNVTGLAGAFGVALDSTGTIYVADNPAGYQQGSINLYPPGSYAAGVPPITSIAGPDTQLVYPIGVAVDRSGDIFALNGSNNGSNFITEYPAGSAGNAVPSAFFRYQVRGIEFLTGLAVNGRGKLYVTVSANTRCAHNSCHQINGGKVLIWPAGSNGGDGLEKPSAVITGPNTALAFPSAIAMDGGGAVYVTNIGPLNCLPNCGCAYGPGSITIYAPGSTGDAKPIRVIAGAKTGLGSPQGIALDSNGSIYVSNAEAYARACVPKRLNEILVFAAGSNGDVAPIATIGGLFTGYIFPNGIAVGPTGN